MSGSTADESLATNPRIDVLGDTNILSLIFDNLVPDPQGTEANERSDRRALLNVAQTCTTFMEPALDALWKILPSLLPLLLLLPSFNLVDDVYMLGGFADGDWERFDVHARRVRNIYMKPLRSPISPEVYLLIQRMRDFAVLPALQELCIPDNSSLPLSSAFLLPREHLKTLELNNSAICTPQFIYQFIPFISDISPTLTHLVLRGTASISLDFIPRFTRLRSLEIQLSGTYLYPQTMEELGNLEDLVNLILDVGPVTPTLAPIRNRRQRTSSQPSAAVPSRKFYQLRHLRIIGTPMTMSRVFDHMELRSLETIIIDEKEDVSGSSTENFWIRCFERLSSSHLVSSIEINQTNQRRWGHDHYSLSMPWMSPLFGRLRNVERFVVKGASLSGSDGDFHDLSIAFPLLKTLITPPLQHSHGLTLASLSYLTQQCPELKELQICFGPDITKNITALKETKVPFRHEHTLQKLSIASRFGNLNVTQMAEIAQFLQRAFPNLKVVEGYGDYRDSESWSQILELCVIFQNVRFGLPDERDT
ncbi:hypothetical protein B0H34DRAFT_677500 [Crassisporium funariophilum]|nr:hypothetical protein B0H34DRAFT_677500 [Crassisporium funariophilum]